jgi:hypothetical protein
MRTRTVELFCELQPGWQDLATPAVYFSTFIAPRQPGDRTLRVKIIAELPHHGGSADVDATIASTTETVPEPAPAPEPTPSQTEPLPEPDPVVPEEVPAEQPPAEQPPATPPAP